MKKITPLASKIFLFFGGIFLFPFFANAEPLFIKDAFPAPETHVQKEETITYSIFLEDSDGLEGFFTVRDLPDFPQKGITLDQKHFNVLKDGQFIYSKDNSPAFSFECAFDEQGSFSCDFDVLPQCRTGVQMPCVFGPPPQKIEIQLKGVVNEKAQEKVCNQAEFTYQGEPMIDEVCHPLAPKNIRLQKSSFPSSQVELEMGQEFEYYLRVYNEENQTLYDFFIQDQIDPDLQILNFPSICDWDLDTRTLTCFIEEIGPQETSERIKINVKVKETAPEYVCNQAFLNHNQQEYTSDQICHFISLGSPSLDKGAYPVAESLLRPFEPLTYTLTVHNPTDEELPSVLVRDTFPQGVAVDNTQLPQGCTWNASSREMVCLVNVPSRSFTRLEIGGFVTRSAENKRICNTATLSLDADHTIPSLPVCHNVGEDLWVFEKTASPLPGTTVESQDQIDYLLTVENTEEGLGLEETLVITDTLDEQLSLIPESLPEACSFKTENNITTITCTFQDLPQCRTGIQVPCRFGPASEKIQIPFSVKVRENAVNEVCNNATLTYLDRPLMPYRTSNTVCHPLKEAITPPQIQKTSSPISGSQVAPGESITYTITGTHSLPINSTRVYITDQIDENLEIITFPDYCTQESQTLTCEIPQQEDFEINLETRVKETAPPETLIANRAQGDVYHKDDLENPINTGVSNTVIHTVKSDEPPLPDIQITKSSDISQGSNITAQSSLVYTLNVENTSGEVLENVVLNDPLPSGYTYVSHTNSTECTGGTTVNCTFETLSPGAIKTLTIQVKAKDAPGTHCNVASVLYDKGSQTGLTLNSNSVCHTITSGGGGGGGGGGGSTTNPTIGTCAIQTSNGKWECIPRYPYDGPNHHDPHYDAYQECRQNPTKTEAECLITWAHQNGYQVCDGRYSDDSYEYFNESNFQDYITENPFITVPYPGSQSFDLANQRVLENQCTSGQEIIGGGGGNNCINDGDLKITMNIEKTLQNNKNSQIIARGDVVDYTVTVTPEVTKDNSIRLTNVTMTIYDYTIPHRSGKIWHREGILNENGDLNQTYTDNNGNVWNLEGSIAGGIQFTTDIAPEEIANPKTLTYAMNSELGIRADVAQLQNVAFVRLKATYVKTDANGDSQEVEVEGLYGDSSENSLIPSLTGIDNICGIGNTDPSSLGSIATVNVIRPFLDARGGGQVGNLSASEDQQKTFGSISVIGEALSEEGVTIDATDVYAQNSDDDLPDLSFVDEDGKDAFFTELSTNANEEVTLFGQNFTTTPDQGGVYFRDGPLTLDSNDIASIDHNMTIVLNQGNLILEEDIRIPDNFFVAFIVRNGDLWIGENIERLDGIYIVDNPDKAVRSGTGWDEVSKKQLTISGGLIGNAQSLAGNRRYIGKKPDEKLEPSIRILFDLRLLDATPPRLERFLGGEWKPSVQ